MDEEFFCWEVDEGSVGSEGVEAVEPVFVFPGEVDGANEGLSPSVRGN